MKTIQTAGITGTVVVPITGRYLPKYEFFSFEVLMLAFVVVALASSLCLAFMGERARAWNGAIITVLWTGLMVAASTPMVIR